MSVDVLSLFLESAMDEREEFGCWIHIRKRRKISRPKRRRFLGVEGKTKSASKKTTSIENLECGAHVCLHPKFTGAQKINK